VSRVLPRPFEEASPTELSGIRGICLDIDDTLSTEGKLEADAYSALWRLKNSGFWVVPITGRPAGWCDLIARFWPVDAVIGENGAFSFFLEQSEGAALRSRRRWDTPKGEVDSQLQQKLHQLRQDIFSHFPWAQMASDQPYREYDLAIDICEDVPPWPAQEVERLIQFAQDRGAKAKLSSIHVNLWFGEYDKKKGFDHWLDRTRGEARHLVAPTSESWLYIGDSPNDEPLFATFKTSVGVANLKKYYDRLQFLPTWITSAESGAGFVQMADRLTRERLRVQGR